jgi:ASC-1-like (ASCH) protein
MTTINVQEPWFSYIKNNKKKVEGRLNKGLFATLKKGDEVIFKNNDESVKARIKKIVKYDTFEEYLSQEGLKRTLPNIKTIKDGCNVYYQYYNKEQEQQYKILAIYIKIIK